MKSPLLTSLILLDSMPQSAARPQRLSWRAVKSLVRSVTVAVSHCIAADGIFTHNSVLLKRGEVADHRQSYLQRSMFQTVRRDSLVQPIPFSHSCTTSNWQRSLAKVKQ